MTQLDRYPLPPSSRSDERDPWPVWPWILRSYPAHEEGGVREFSVAVNRFIGDSVVEGVELVDVIVENRVATPVPGSERVIPADLVLLAIGFSGTDALAALGQLGVDVNDRGTVDCGPSWETSAPGVFVAGDAHRGASLIVWAIAEGRAAAAAIHSYFDGAGSLPAPVAPSSQALAAV